MGDDVGINGVALGEKAILEEPGITRACDNSNLIGQCGDKQANSLSNLVKSTVHSFLATLQQGNDLPIYVRAELEDYLKCGRL